VTWFCHLSNGRGVTVTAMDWETEYEPAADFPQRPPYIGHYGMGVVSTGGHFTLRNAGTSLCDNLALFCYVLHIHYSDSFIVCICFYQYYYYAMIIRLYRLQPPKMSTSHPRCWANTGICYKMHALFLSMFHKQLQQQQKSNNWHNCSEYACVVVA